MENFNIKSEFVLEKFQFDQKFIIKWLKLKNIKESHLLLIAGLSDGNIHHAKFLISQSFEEFLSLSTRFKHPRIKPF